MIAQKPIVAIFSIMASPLHSLIMCPRHIVPIGADSIRMVTHARKRLGISQAEFAARYHVPIGTLRDWEQNRKQPDAPSLAYLRVIAREPGVVARALQREAA
jgi:DNA-binding XRE family transcriptional regulator